MIDFSNVKVKIASEAKGHAVVEVEPLSRGYGYTIGNAIRRALLSSIEGAAITSMKIDGTQHEYSTIPGMLEDVLNFTLNLRDIAFNVHSDEPQVVTLSVSGKKEVLASDIKLTADVEIANPDILIAHLTNTKAKLNIEMTVEKGTGFVYADENKRAEVGVIPLDANFSPIEKVGFKVSNVRVGQKTDFDKITLDLDLKANITAKEAITQACKYIADGYVRMIKSLKEDYLEEDVVYGEYEPVKPEVEEITHKNGNNGVDLKAVKIQELHVSGRVVKALSDKDITNVDELLDYKESEIRLLRGIGNASMRELKDALDKLGVSLKEDE